MTAFDGKVVLVTGGGSGIGQAAALAFAKEGAKVVVSGRRVEAGEETVHQVSEAGGEAIFVKSDVTVERDVENLVHAVMDKYGRLDAAFNNAGVEGSGQRLTEMAEADWDRILDTNLKSVWLSLKYEVPQMLENGGAIVNNSSVLGQVGLANASAYSASKAGIIGLTRSAAIEYAKSRIRINAVAPGVVMTPMSERAFGLGVSEQANQAFAAAHPVGRIGSPDEIADAVLWLCSDSSVFVTGQTLSVDGGFTTQ